MEDIYIGKKQNKDKQEYEDIYITPKNRRGAKPEPFFDNPEDEPDYEPSYDYGSDYDDYASDADEPIYGEDELKVTVNSRQGRTRTEQAPKRRKRKSKLARKIKALVLAVIVLCGAVTGLVYHTFSSVNYSETGHKDNVFLEESALMQSSSVKNILLLGVDRRNADESSRSDTMLLVSINSKTKKIILTSFMRDTYVYIPEKKRNAKLNAACTWGGAQMVMDTIEYNFNIKIDHYMLVDFTMFEDIINGLGGIDVSITEKEAKYMRDAVHLTNIQAGDSIHLNGKEALWYCRIRKLDSDFMRTKRQRKVVTALIDQCKQTNPFSLYSLLGDIVSQIETDMSPAALTSLAMNGLLRYLSYDIEQGRVPAENMWKSKRINGQDVLSVDIAANKKYLEEFIYE